MATATEPECESEQMELLLMPGELRITPLGDGSHRVKQMPPRPMPQYVSVRKAASLLGLGPRQVQNLARQMGARQRADGCRLRIPLEAVLAAAGREAR